MSNKQSHTVQSSPSDGKKFPKFFAAGPSDGKKFPKSVAAESSDGNKFRKSPTSGRPADDRLRTSPAAETSVLDVVMYLLAALLLIGSIVLFMENIASWAPYTFMAGAVLYLLYHLRNAYRGNDFRLKRLNRLFALNIILLAASAWLMYVGNNSFMVLMLLAALLEFYRSWRSAQYLKDTSEE